jgi:hypothetical protein
MVTPVQLGAHSLFKQLFPNEKLDFPDLVK